MIAARRPKPLLTIRECADALGVSATTADAFARRNELPGLVTLNGRYCVRRALFESWLAGVGELPSAATSDGLPEVGTRRAANPSAVQEGA